MDYKKKIIELLEDIESERGLKMAYGFIRGLHEANNDLQFSENKMQEHKKGGAA